MSDVEVELLCPNLAGRLDLTVEETERTEFDPKGSEVSYMYPRGKGMGCDCAERVKTWQICEAQREMVRQR